MSAGSAASARATSSRRCSPSGKVPARSLPACRRGRLAPSCRAASALHGTFLGTIEPQRARQEAGAASSVSAERDIVEKRHARAQASHAERFAQARAAPRRRCRAARHPRRGSGRGPRIGRGEAGEEIEQASLLPAPFGPMRPRISPARSSKPTSLTATRPPKRFDDAFDRQGAACRSGSARGAAKAVPRRWRAWARAAAGSAARRERGRSGRFCRMRMKRAPSATASKLGAVRGEERQEGLQRVLQEA